MKTIKKPVIPRENSGTRTLATKPQKRYKKPLPNCGNWGIHFHGTLVKHPSRKAAPFRKSPSFRVNIIIWCRWTLIAKKKVSHKLPNEMAQDKFYTCKCLKIQETHLWWYIIHTPIFSRYFFSLRATLPNPFENLIFLCEVELYEKLYQSRLWGWNPPMIFIDFSCCKMSWDYLDVAGS